MEQVCQKFENLQTCRGSNRAQYLCYSQECSESALLCGNIGCGCIAPIHQNCKFLEISSFLKSILSKRRMPPQSIIRSIDKISAIYQEIIDTLSIDRQKLQKWRQYYGLSYQEIELVNGINTNNEIQLTGHKVSAIRKSLKLSHLELELTEERVKQNWEKQMKVFAYLRSALEKLKEGPQPNNISLGQQFVWITDNQSQSAIFSGNAIRTKLIPYQRRFFLLSAKQMKQDKPISWCLKIINNGEWLGLGIGLKNRLLKLNQLNGPSQVDHGSYMISQNASLWPIPVKGHSHVVINGLDFKPGDFLAMRYCPLKGQLEFIKNMNVKRILLNIPQAQIGDTYCPCICGVGKDCSVEIIACPTGLYWE